MIVGIDEQLQVTAQFVVAAIVAALDPGIFDRAAHSLDLVPLARPIERVPQGVPKLATLGPVGVRFRLGLLVDGQVVNEPAQTSRVLAVMPQMGSGLMTSLKASRAFCLIGIARPARRIVASSRVPTNDCPGKPINPDLTSPMQVGSEARRRRTAA